MNAVIHLPVSIQALVNHAERRATSADLKAAVTVEDVKAELRADMAKALKGEIEYVPSTVLRQFSLQPSECLQGAGEGIMTTLDHLTVLRHLRAVLKSSACPHVQALRDSMVNGFADMYGEDIAEIRKSSSGRLGNA